MFAFPVRDFQEKFFSLLSILMFRGHLKSTFSAGVDSIKFEDIEILVHYCAQRKMGSSKYFKSRKFVSSRHNKHILRILSQNFPELEL